MQTVGDNFMFTKRDGFHTPRHRPSMTATRFCVHGRGVDREADTAIEDSVVFILN